MYKDEFDSFVFDDAIERLDLKVRDAHARVDFHRAWIHHAIERLACAEGPAERRAAQKEIEQDIRHLQARHGWGQEMMSAFHRRLQAAPAKAAIV